MNELIDEITQLQNNKEITKEEKESYEAVSTVMNTSKKILDSLKLEEVLGKEEIADVAQKDLKTLITQVDEFKKSGILTPIHATTNIANDTSIVNSGGIDLAQTTRIATLEHKLHQLEQAIGARPEKLSRLSSICGTTNLLEAVQQLNTKAALLQPGQLDLIEARLNNLSTKMDSIVEKTSGQSTIDTTQRDQKVLELYEIAKRTEPIAQILPDMLERMQALEALHKYGKNFFFLFFVKILHILIDIYFSVFISNFFLFF